MKKLPNFFSKKNHIPIQNKYKERYSIIKSYELGGVYKVGSWVSFCNNIKMFGIIVGIVVY